MAEKFRQILEKRYSLLILGLIIGAGTGFLISNQTGVRSIQNSFSEKRHNKDYKFINPLLECEVSNPSGPPEFKELDSRVNDYINSTISSGIATQISYYYRDLNNGPWVGIHEKEDFTPSSLLKLPILIAFLKDAEKDPASLSKSLVYKRTHEYELSPVYLPSKALEDGQSYTIEELLSRMIIYSDNYAKDLLLSDIDPNLINQVYLDLGILVPPDTLADNFMSVKEYSSLFRVLFNGSYLSKEMSEKALKLLSQVEFNKAITAGLPSNVVVAHKFGERELASGLNQLHDCGIVYYPDHPYLICVMTRGNDLKTLPTVISDISKITYQEIKARFQ